MSSICLSDIALQLLKESDLQLLDRRRQTLERVNISSLNEQEEWNGWRLCWKNAISEVGWQLNHPRMEVFPDFSSSTPEEKWKSGRWSPGKDGGEEEEKLLFLSRRSNFQATGVCVWWGAFTQCGDIPLLMTGSKNFWTKCKKVKVNPRKGQSSVESSTMDFL